MIFGKKCGYREIYMWVLKFYSGSRGYSTNIEPLILQFYLQKSDIYSLFIREREREGERGGVYFLPFHYDDFRLSKVRRAT